MKNDYKPFKRAVPVFAEGMAEEMNITCGFYGSIKFSGNSGEPVIFKAAASNFYKLYINGKFVYYGPCRCGHGWYRVDEIDITDKLKKGKNHIAVEVVAYNVNTFFSLDQPGFLQCELFSWEKSLLATLDTEKPRKGAFRCFVLNDRVRKMQKFSFQRPMTEAYRLYPGVFDWKTGDASNVTEVRAEKTGKKKLTERILPLNKFSKALPKYIYSTGTIKRVPLPENRWADRSLVNISPILKGYKEADLEIHLSDEVQTIKSDTVNNMNNTCYFGFDVMGENSFEILSLAGEKTGFLTFKVDCLEDSEFYFMMDETLINEDVNPLSMECVNALKFECKKGVYDFMSMECYGFKHMKIAVTKGKIVLSELGVTEYVSPMEITYEYKGENEAHIRVIDAAIETFKQNSADLFMDCPTRERAGWLCDSYFTARTERLLTGTNKTEYVFLQNFLLSEGFEDMPEGMLPCCYPADLRDGLFIPNWAMFYVLQLEDYLKRGGDKELVAKSKKLVYGLFKYFKKYENELGLLEKLDGWIFVEWSKANDLVRDLNYPTNMCYQACLRAAGKMFDDPKLIKKADKIAKVIRKRSYNGKFFEDRENRVDGQLVKTHEVTETCQYYAFYFGIATKEKYPGLWNTLVKKFGPDRMKKGYYPEVFKANSFVGNYMRLDLLRQAEMYDQLSAEIGGYFDYMAKKTGTLWENEYDFASCNHGFASYASIFIDASVNRENREWLK